MTIDNNDGGGGEYYHVGGGGGGFDLTLASSRSDHGVRILCMLGGSYRLRKPIGNRTTFTDDSSSTIPIPETTPGRVVA